MRNPTPPWMVLPTGCGPAVPLTKTSATQPLVMRKPSLPPYSNQLWLPVVGVITPLLATVATMPDCVAKDCTKAPLILASKFELNKWVHCPPTLTRLVRSVPPPTVALKGLKVVAG